MVMRLLAIASATLLALAVASAQPATGSRSMPPVAPSVGWSWPLRPGPDRIVKDFDPPAWRAKFTDPR